MGMEVQEEVAHRQQERFPSPFNKHGSMSSLGVSVTDCELNLEYIFRSCEKKSLNSSFCKEYRRANVRDSSFP